VVGSQRAIEADLLVRPHRREHVRLPFVVESFHEALRGAPHIPELNEVQPAVIDEGAYLDSETVADTSKLEREYRGSLLSNISR
jgi:hypothetical protein